ncbi:MAG: tetratricopeptide (TPR) repeat protein [Flavobacteriaceae bacterium]|jgi:tetratricopeptide (TPR) repeat protein
MGRQQIIVVVIAVIAVCILYQLPRVVVENEGVTSMGAHELSISTKDEAVFSSLIQLLNNTTEIKKSINFADSLASLYLKYQMLDSAVEYANVILAIDSSRLAKFTGALIYYKAFQSTNDPQEAKKLAATAAKHIEDLLVDDPQSSVLKNKLAMTLMVTDTPMAGVQLLREILEEDPENRETILNLGLLAIRSRQFDRAIERFETLISLDSSDSESRFYLGLSQVEAGDTLVGKATLKKVIGDMNINPALKATVSSYLEELENI